MPSVAGYDGLNWKREREPMQLPGVLRGCTFGTNRRVKAERQRGLATVSRQRLSFHRRLRRIGVTLELLIIPGATVSGTAAEVEAADLFALLRVLAEAARPS